MKIQADPNKIEALSERVKRSRRTLEALFTEVTRIARNTAGSARSAYPEHRGVQSASNELEKIIAQIRQDASQFDLLLANQAKQLFTIATTYRRQEQEATRMLLRKFAVGTKASIVSNEMQKQVAHSTDAWPYDPMYAGNVPILPNQHYQYLLGLAATDSIEGDQAFSQLQDIKVAREELGQAYLSLITHVQEGNASGCWQDIYRILEVAKKLNKYNLFTQPPQPMEPLEPVPKEEPHWWDKMIDGIQDVGEETWAGLQTFGNSIKEIGLDFNRDANDRAEKSWDSPYDFVNYWTFGIPDLVVGTYAGMEERAAKWDDSVYDFSNWLTFGTVEMVDGALFPREPLSKEHLYDVIGLSSLLAPLKGMIASKGAGKTVGAGEVQILGRENDVFGKQMDDGTGKGGKEASEAYDYRKVNKQTNSIGETLATRKQVKQFKKKWEQSGIPVIVDKKGKILKEGYEAAFDYGNGQIFIKKKPTVVNLYHEGYHTEQWLDIGKDAYMKLGRLEREEYVFEQIMKNQHLFDDASIKHSIEYINRLRLKYK